MLTNRSTKGASRQRRELINTEINTIRDLLPLQEGVRKRLSQLQIMAICKAFIGKNNFFSKINDAETASLDKADFSSEFSQALPGFLLMATVDGKFLYLSDNVMEVLGNSMIDFITQAETVFELFDERGQGKLVELLSGFNGNSGDAYATGCIGGESGSVDEEVTFTCLMGLTKNLRRHPGLDRQKVMKVRACLVRPYSCVENAESSVLVALCSPWPTFIPTADPTASVFSTTVFLTRHSLDMKFLSMHSNGEYHLGYSAKELQLRSIYELIHPDHENEFTTKHLELISSGVDSFSSIFLRVQTFYGHFIWLHVIMRLIPGSDINASKSEIVCTNHVINEEELAFMREREQLEAEMANYSNQNQFYANANTTCVLPFPTAVVDDRFLVVPGGNSIGQISAWDDGIPAKKMRKTGAAYKHQQNVWAPLGSDDFSSSSGCSSMSFHSPVSMDVDKSFQFHKMEEAYGSTSCLDVCQMDFNLQTEDHFQLNAPSPYSVFSDSAIGSSPRMFPEDDGTFFNSMTPVADQGKISSKPMTMSSSSLDDLIDLQSCSEIQGVPLLPELSISELNDYLSVMEDVKKEVNIPQNFHNLTCSSSEAVLPAYNWNHNIIQQNPTRSQLHKVNNTTGLTYDPSAMSRSTGEFNVTRQAGPEHAVKMKNENTSYLTGEVFLERLIESPQFTELIGMLETESQRFQGFHEDGLMSYG